MLLLRRSKLYYTASGIITPIGGRPVHRLREDWLEWDHNYRWPSGAQVERGMVGMGSHL